MYAYITLDGRYLLAEDSTCTIGDTTIPLPERPHADERIVAAVAALGYVPVGDYHATIRRVPGGCQIPIKEA